MRVLIADKLSPHVAEALEAAGCAVTYEPTLKGETLTEALASHEPGALVVRSTKVTSADLDAAPSLALIIRGGAGVNTIDVAEASRRGVYVANCPGKNAIAVAELTFGHLLNLDRRISDNVSDLRRGVWNKKGYGKATGVFGRTMAVLGMGMIGTEVVKRAKAFGMHVKAWSRSLTPERAEELGVTFARTPREACSGADVLTVHLALNADTRGLVGRELLDALAPGAFVINTSRGGVIDQEALLEAIARRGLRAGLDVFAEEPAATDVEFPFPIREEAGVYGTHHIGASTTQASNAVGDEIVRILQTYLSTGRVLNCVNLADRSPATHVLAVRHADKVGVLAAVLGVLKEGGVNVQEMENIIFAGAHAACARIQVDAPPIPEILRLINELPDVFATSLVALET